MNEDKKMGLRLTAKTNVYAEDIRRFLMTNDLKECIPALAAGSEAKASLKRSVAAKRRIWRNLHKHRPTE